MGCTIDKGLEYLLDFESGTNDFKMQSFPYSKSFE
jgi:hypothetical protein